MASKKDRFSKAIGENIEKELEKKQAILNELTDSGNSTSESNKNILEIVEEVTPEEKEMKSTSITGAEPGEFSKERSDAWHQYSPSARSMKADGGVHSVRRDNAPRKPFKPYVQTTDETFDEDKMKKVIIFLVAIGLVGGILYYWKPWTSGVANTVTLSLNKSYISKRISSSQSTFRTNEPIFYRIDRAGSLDTDTIIVRISRIGPNGEKTLFREDVETHIDPSANRFIYALRQDYFTEKGKYAIDIYFSRDEDAAPVASAEILIK